MHNDPEPVCYLLDRRNLLIRYNDTPEDFTRFYKNVQNNIDTEKLQLETYFTQPTSALNMKSLEPLNDIKPYMREVVFLNAHTKAHFKPHYDTCASSQML